jgi:hypothetical protein
MNRNHIYISSILILIVFHAFAQDKYIMEQYEQMADTVYVQNSPITAGNIPEGYRFDKDLGMLLHNSIEGQVLFRNTFRGFGMDCPRAVVTPKGDYLLMFPVGEHYGSGYARDQKPRRQVNRMTAFRSKDKGETWEGPTLAFDIEYDQHGFVPLIPKASNRIYAFGTQPIFELFDNQHGPAEDAPIGYRYSDDDGYTWSEVRIIRPLNDPGFRGMSCMRMTETDRGTWLIGAHTGDYSYSPLLTRQYILRSEDRGETWHVLPGKRNHGWFVRGFGRMDEGRVINIGSDEVFLMTRTPAGHLWASRSFDDGNTWSRFEPTSLIHPDAPPMLFKLSDGKTLIALHHNISSVKTPVLGGDNQHDRSELWIATSKDGGRTWSKPRFLLATALRPAFGNDWKDYNASYCDMFADNGQLHLFMSHRWSRAVYLTFGESDLDRFLLQEKLLNSN